MACYITAFLQFIVESRVNITEPVKLAEDQISEVVRSLDGWQSRLALLSGRTVRAVY